tara:strand:- start:2373 stop:2840 length:468 start_codon:yes stop_codon:yes gene_type:complete
MSNVKKVFADIAVLLEENSNRKVSTILPQLMELMTSKNSGGSDIGKTFLKDENGEVVAIFCYYHKKWELVSDCEYGSKKGTSTNLNTMCKEGVSHWTKQKRVAKKGKEDLLNQVMDGEVAQEDIGSAMAELELSSKVIVAREDGHGYDLFGDLPQ